MVNSFPINPGLITRKVYFEINRIVCVKVHRIRTASIALGGSLINQVFDLFVPQVNIRSVNRFP